MVSLDKARDFVYKNGTLWEVALFDYLFYDGSLNWLHQCLLCYKNEDGGWGHGIEADIKCPDSNPTSIEFLLTIIRDTDIPIGNLLDGTIEWLENNRNKDGSFNTPETLFDYPHARWMKEDINQTIPDSITGNLTKLGICTPTLQESTDQWVRKNLTEEKILSNKWLFMCYHANDYYFNISSHEFNKKCKEATIKNIIECAEKTTENQYHTLFHFVKSRDSELANAIPDGIIDKFIDYLHRSQREDGGWDDEHGLKYWQPYTTIQILCALRNFNKI